MLEYLQVEGMPILRPEHRDVVEESVLVIDRALSNEQMP